MSSFNKDGLSPLRAATSVHFLVGDDDDEEEDFDVVGDPETSYGAHTRFERHFHCDGCFRILTTTKVLTLLLGGFENHGRT